MYINTWKQAAWNLLLSLFSFVGLIRTLPQLIYNLTSMSIRDNFCKDPAVTFGSGSSGLWVQLFILSKFPWVKFYADVSWIILWWAMKIAYILNSFWLTLFFSLLLRWLLYFWNSELFDTFFIIIHKKPLIFLHWYHHITVLLYCWHSYVTKSPYGLFFVTMNYGVHAIMYGYYFLMAIKMKPKWLNAMFITGAQISQMIVGIIVTVFAFYFYQTEKDESNPCFIQKENNIAAFIMYGSYLFLFMQFFTLRYQPRSRKHIKKLD